jgi:hypothetical protein
MIGRCVLGIGILTVVAVSTVQAQERTFGGVITGGSVTVTDPGGFSPQADYDISGEGFRIVAAGTDGGAAEVFLRCSLLSPDACLPGQVIPLSATFANTNMGTGTAMVNGEVLSPAFMSGYFEFQGGSITIPSFKRKRILLTTGFTFAQRDGSPLPMSVYPDESSRFNGSGVWATGTIM